MILAAIALSAAPPVVTAGETFTCTPVRVWDGDGPLWCAEGPRIRVAGIAAREMDGTCRDGHPCPKASAEEARAALVKLVGKPVGRHQAGHILVKGPALQCRSRGNGKGARTDAFCDLPDGRNLSCAMLKTKTVELWKQYWTRGPSCP